MKAVSRDGLILLDGIPFAFDAAAAARKLKIPDEGADFEVLRNMLADARRAGSGKAAYRECFPSGRTENGVVIEGESFKSRVLAVNLENARRVFLYVVTCGRELDEWSAKYSDPLYSYFADYIKEAALAGALEYFYSYIEKTYCVKKYSKMAPGALNDWPLEEQKPLFRALGDVKLAAGVGLTESFLMLPSKSVSGILFPAETSFESCMLCPRGKCPGRRAPYDEGLYGKRFSNKEGGSLS